MQNSRIELPSPGWKPGILTVVIILLLPICSQFCLHTINIANSNCLMPNTEFQMPAPSSKCLIPNALSPSCSRTVPQSVLVPVPTLLCYRTDTVLLSFRHRSVIVPTLLCSRTDTVLLPFRHCSVTVPTPFFTQLRLWQAVCI